MVLSLSLSLVAEQEIHDLTGSAAMHLARSLVGSTRDLSNSSAYAALHLQVVRADSHTFDNTHSYVSLPPLPPRAPHIHKCTHVQYADGSLDV